MTCPTLLLAETTTTAASQLYRQLQQLARASAQCPDCANYPDCPINHWQSILSATILQIANQYQL